MKYLPFMIKRFYVKAVGFDNNYYKKTYIDVARSGMSAQEHYNNHGWMEGRNPSSEFNSFYFMFNYMQNGEPWSNPLNFYLKNKNEYKGKGVGKPKSITYWLEQQKKFVKENFDEIFYHNNYAESLGGLSPIDHYFDIGWKLGFNPTRHFNTKQYLDANKHIHESDINPFFHYLFISIMSGANLSKKNYCEKSLSADHTSGTIIDVVKYSDRANTIKTIAAAIDTNFYLSEYADVREAGLNPIIHYIDYGWKEGRDPSPIFWTNFYLTSYRTVIPVDMNPLVHYEIHGKKLGYLPNPYNSSFRKKLEAPSESVWTGLRADLKTNVANITVIMPVYLGYDETLAAIISVITNKQNTKYKFLVINDNSPDIKLTQKLRELSRANIFGYIENIENIGFVKSINKALKWCANDDVIILNSDTQVYGDWLDRMVAHASRNFKVATITPLSNNATLCSYPQAFKNNNYELECSTQDLDNYTSVCNRGLITEIPTGVGFCMYMRRSVIDAIGDFDEEFGLGYGEENDFCMRAIKNGFVNICANDIFVYHSGQVSFQTSYQDNYNKSQDLLFKKHPDYLIRINSHIKANTGLLPRLRLDLFRISKNLKDRKVVFVSIKANGGLETHIKNLAARLNDEGVSVIILYLNENVYGGFSVSIFSLKEKLVDKRKVIDNVLFDTQLLSEFLSWINPEFIHIHSFANVEWSKIYRFMNILLDNKIDYYFTLHDYDTICHRHHLVDLEGGYCEPFIIDKCNNCIRNSASSHEIIEPSRRIDQYNYFLSSAKKVFVPSKDAQKRLNRFFPNINLFIKEHEENFLNIDFLPLPKKSKYLRITVLGAIGPHKGVNLLHALALDARLNNLPIKYTVIGHTSIPEELEKLGVIETGRYLNLSECLLHFMNIETDFIFLPSIWPETYCYVLSISFALGIPPIVFNLGAQAERVKNKDFGVILENSLLNDISLLNKQLLGLSVRDEWRKRKEIEFNHYNNILEDYYYNQD